MRRYIMQINNHAQVLIQEDNLDCHTLVEEQKMIRLINKKS
ncbi:hypothetical protein [Bacillus cereus]|nr:hypothetical protein [Bacillus cereus]